MVDLKVASTTIPMLPPQGFMFDRVTFEGRFYTAIPGVPQQVLVLDAPVLQGMGWTYVSQVSVQLNQLSLSSFSFVVGAPQGTLVANILGATPGSTIALDSLSIPGALQVVGTRLEVGPTPPTSSIDVTFNLIEMFSSAPNSPRTTTGFTVSALSILPVPVNTSIPIVTGIAQEGQILTASTGTWLNNPTSFAYQWKRDNIPISGATASTYLATDTDVGTALTTSVLATNITGTSAPATSLPTATVIAAPVITPVPENGTQTRYVRMSATHDAADPAPGFSIWEMEVYAATSQATNIALNKAATASSQFDGTKTPSKAFDGNTTTTRWASLFDSGDHWIYVDLAAGQITINEVIIRWEASFSTHYSAQVSDDAVNWANIYTTTTGAGGVVDISQRPTISGTPQVGETLTASPGIWTNSPTSFAYQWNRGMTPIVGANAPSYVPTTSDVGSGITISVIASNAGGQSLPATSAPTATIAAVVSPPSVLPTIFGLGLKSSPVTGWWMAQSGVPWNYRYQYLNNGWENWNTPSGAIVTFYTQFSIDNGYIPVFTWYLAGSQMNGNPATLWSNLATPSYMNAYFTSFKLMLQKAGAFTSPVIAHIEPDMWGFMQQQLSQDPTTIPVSVASSGFSGLGGFPNNASGLAQALIALRNTYAPNVLLGWDNVMWAVNYDPTTTADPTAAGTSVVSFYNLLSASFDLIIFNTSDADSAYKVIVRGIASATAWWTDTAFSNFKQYISTIYQATGRKSMLWQTPVGNTLYRSCNNTPGHYQDNRPEYFLKTGNRQHILDFVNAGVIGILFGEGQEIALTNNPCTSYLDQMGDGITNPAPIAGGTNSLVASHSDDDGGFLRIAGAEYYQSPAVLPATPPPAVPINTAIPTISGTAREGQTLTASNGTWTNNPLSYAYQWKRAGASISGATASTYVQTSADVGFRLTVSVTASNAAGSSVAATSNPTAIVTAVSTLIFPADTSPTTTTPYYPIITQETLSLPGYLVDIPGSQTALGNHLMRIDDETTFGGARATGVGAIKMNKHHYSKDQPWNADESRIYLRNAGSTGGGTLGGVILNGSTYAFISTLPSFASGDKIWSNTNKDLLYGVQGTGTPALKTYNIATSITTTLATFPQYSVVTLGNAEGNLSDDDRYICLIGVSGTSLVVFVYDIVNNVVTGSRTFANTTLSNNIDYATMSPSGQYVIITMINTALGYPARSAQLFDRQMNHIRQLGGYVSHSDFGYDSSGNEIMIAWDSTTGDIFHAYFYTAPLSTGIARRETPVGSVSNPFHVSCRNIRRPGWAYISESASTDPTHPLSYYQPYFNYNEIFALKLDGSGTVERFAKEHHVTDPSFNQITNDGYNRSQMGVPSRNGDRVIFASDWGDVSTSAFIHTFVAWYA